MTGRPSLIERASGRVMTRREWCRHALLLGGGALVVAACGGPKRAPDRPELEGLAPQRPASRDAGKSPQQEALVLTFGVMERLGGMQTVAQQAVQDWNRGELPGPENRPQLELVSIPQQQNKSWRDSFALYLAGRSAAGVPLDFVWMHSTLDFSYTFTHRLLAPLTSYAQTDKAKLLDRFWEPALQLARYERQLMAVPVSVLPLMTVYDEELFKVAGVPPPSRTWTREDFIAAGKLLTRDVDGDRTIDQWGYIEWSIPGWLPFILQEGGDVVDFDTGKVRIAERAAQRGLTFWLDLGRVHSIMPHGPDVDWQTLRGTVQGRRRQGAMFFNAFFSRFGSGLRPATIPAGPNTGVPLGLQEALAMPTDAGSGAEAYTAMVHLADHLSQNRFVPATSSGLEFIRQPDAGHAGLILEPAIRDVLLDLLISSQPTPVASGGELTSRLASIISLPLARGEISVERAAQQAHEAIVEYLTPKEPPTPVPQPASTP